MQKMVRQLVLLAGCCVIMWLGGCQGAGPSVEKTAKAREPFPEFLVGRWKANRDNWEIEFDSDGEVTSMVHYMWAVPIDTADGAYYTDGPDEGTYALFMLGPCEADYKSATRELSVKIIMEKYEIMMPGGMLEGWLRDFFDGPVSEDGKVWTASWRHMEWLEGADESVDPNFGASELTFTKVDEAE